MCLPLAPASMRGGPGIRSMTGATVACRAVTRTIGRATRIGTACVAHLVKIIAFYCVVHRARRTAGPAPLLWRREPCGEIRKN
nr:MAG TPA: hypothetical protein [Caudoviricetes sp.]